MICNDADRWGCLLPQMIIGSREDAPLSYTDNHSGRTDIVSSGTCSSPCRDGHLQQWLALLGNDAIRCLSRAWRRQDVEYGSALRNRAGDRCGSCPGSSTLKTDHPSADGSWSARRWPSVGEYSFEGLSLPRRPLVWEDESR
jgi:hypothetical protein